MGEDKPTSVGHKDWGCRFDAAVALRLVAVVLQLQRLLVAVVVAMSLAVGNMRRRLRGETSCPALLLT